MERSHILTTYFIKVDLVGANLEGTVFQSTVVKRLVFVSIQETLSFHFIISVILIRFLFVYYIFLVLIWHQEALKAMTAMHSKVIKGRPLIVTFAYAVCISISCSCNLFTKRCALLMEKMPCSALRHLIIMKMVNLDPQTNEQQSPTTVQLPYHY